MKNIEEMFRDFLSSLPGDAERAEAMEAYEAQRDGGAEFALAELYAVGVGPDRHGRDPLMASDLYARALKSGDERAIIPLRIKLLNREVCDTALTEAARTHPNAAYALYRCLCREQPEEADKWLQKAAELGSSRAQQVLKTREARKNAPPRERKKLEEMSLLELTLTAKLKDAAGEDSLPYHRRAAELGSEISAFLLNLPDPRDRLAADTTYVNYCEDTCWEYAMADLYYWGFGPDALGKDVDKAFGYFVAAADQDCDAALQDMVEFYWNSRRGEVEKYLAEAASAGDGKAAALLREKRAQA